MDASMSSINASIDQSMIEGEYHIELILHRMKGAYNKCDLNQFTNQFRHRLDAVFKRFIDQNFDEKSELNLDAEGSSSINPTHCNITDAQENKIDDDEEESDIDSKMDEDDDGSDSDTVWIFDSDDEETVFVATERGSGIIPRECTGFSRTSHNKTPIRFSSRRRNIKNGHSSCFACQLKKTNTPSHKSNTNIPIAPKKRKNRCEVCKKEFFSSYDLQVHRMGHLMPDTIHCSVCLRIFDENVGKTKHQSKCKLLRYECYLCGKTLRSRSRCEIHLRGHLKEKKALRKH